MINRSCTRAIACAIALACIAVVDPVAYAAPVVRSAQVTVTMSTPTSCEVAMVLAIDGAGSPVDHRVEADDATFIEGLEIDGAEPAAEPKTIGRTRSLTLAPGQPSYTIRYRVRQPDERRHRCPLWLPAVPTDGVSRSVRMRVQLPSGAAPGSTMPAFTWEGTQGSTTLGHVPAFVLLPYAAPGEPAPRDVARVVDGAAVAVFGAATAIWLWRRKR